ncbi:MAG: FtsK/SpoIIIE domain-containing protein, partial [Verrucomicrobiales bacterium]
MTAREAVNYTGRLRTALQTIEEAHRTISAELKQRQSGLQRQADEQVKRLKEERQKQRADLDDWRCREADLLNRRNEERSRRIANALASSKKRAMEQIDQREGSRKYRVQKTTLEVEKAQEQRLNEIEKNYRKLEKDLDKWDTTIAGHAEMTRKRLAAYASFKKLLKERNVESRLDTSLDETQLLGELARLDQQALSGAKQFNQTFLPLLFRFVPVWIWLLVIGVLVVLGPARLGLDGLSPNQFYTIAGGISFGVLAFWAAGMLVAKTRAKNLVRTIVEAEQAIDLAKEKGAARWSNDQEQTKQETAEKLDALQREWNDAIEEAASAKAGLNGYLEAKQARANGTHQRLMGQRVEWLNHKYESALVQADQEAESALASALKFNADRRAEIEASYAQEFNAKKLAWEQTGGELLAEGETANRFATEHFKPWSELNGFKPPLHALNAVQLGRVNLDWANLAPELISEWKPRLKAAPPLSSIPLMLRFPEAGSLFLESNDTGRELALATMNNVMLRMLQTHPPGKLNLTIVDPLGLGQSFSGIMHLADFEENLVNRRIWTERAEIEERLLDLNAHMEKVIQMYLRNEYADIVEYNKKAGSVAEKTHVLVIADFPVNFSESALQRLLRIVASGPRCGVYTLIHWDKKNPLPMGLAVNDLVQGGTLLQINGNRASLPGLPFDGVSVKMDSPPDAETANQFLQVIGNASRGANQIQVPFQHVAPDENKIWSLETTEELRVPIGRSGATKLQYLSLGKGTKQHVLLAGKTGSGKSTLMHVIITNLALWCSPEQVEFYLIDFKKGVEFKDYANANLPHAKVIAIESDREFGLSVLRRIDEELRQRGELFRKAGAQDLAGFKRADQSRPMPRVLLIVDEFQELFTEEDSVSQNASMLLDRIVRQGRAFGIHVILGSQTLGGAYTLARTTLGQMVVRIALQTNEADAYLIMDENNPAPRMLSRPGEGIYNDAGGSAEANSPFQTVWLSETERRLQLSRLKPRLNQASFESPVVFEGNNLADIADNPLLAALLNGARALSPNEPRSWLGLPNEIKGPTEVAFRRQGGNHLLLVGRSEESMLALLASSILSLTAQLPPDKSKFLILENAVSGPVLTLSDLASMLPHRPQVARGASAGDALGEVVAELERRENGESGNPIFVVIRDLQSFKTLKAEDEFSFSSSETSNLAAAHLQKIINEGASQGIHLIVSIDNFNNVNRFLGRKGLKEFQLRVLFQMSANDSANL